jgi:MFS family permease
MTETASLATEERPGIRPVAAQSLARKLTRNLVLMTAMVLVPAAAVMTYLTLGDFTKQMKPELANKARVLGRTAAADFHRVLEQGTPLYGMFEPEQYLQRQVDGNEEVAYMVIAGADGEITFSAGKVDEQLAAYARRVARDPPPPLSKRGNKQPEQRGTALKAALNFVFPIWDGTRTAGLVHLGIDQGYLARRATDSGYDLLVILIVGLLIALEVTLAMILYYAASPISSLGQLLQRYASGDFSRVLAGRAGDAAGRLSAYLHERTQRLHRRFRIILLRSIRNHEMRTAHEATTRAAEEAREAKQAARITEEGAAVPPRQQESTAEYLQAQEAGRSSRLSDELKKVRQQGQRSKESATIEAMGERFGMCEQGGPSPIIQAAIEDIRIPLFIFAFAEELQKSFLPLFVRSLYQPISWLSESVVIGLPIALYLAMLALAAPYAGRWSDRHGAAKMFVIGLLPAIAGYVGCAFATTIYELIAWRGVTALGYAIVSIACLESPLCPATPQTRSRAIAVFIGVVMSACMCGTAIGGILADRLGYRPVFAVAAVLAVCAGFAARWMLADKATLASLASSASAGADANAAAATTLRQRLQVFRNSRFVVFLATVAIPTNVLIAAFLWYTVPLYLSHLGASQALIGRIMMVYYLVLVVGGGAGSRIGDRRSSLVSVVGIGSLLSAGGLLALQRTDSLWGVVLAVVVMGMAHAVTRVPQFPLALDICSHEIASVGRTTVMSVMRSVERIGSIIGLLAAASLVASYGYRPSIGATGYFVVGASIVFLIVFAAKRRAAGLGPAPSAS